VIFGSSFVGCVVFVHQESSVEIATNGNQTVQGPGYTVDASKLPNQAPSIFSASSKMCVVWRCHDGRQHFFCLSNGRFSLIASCNLSSCEQ